MNQIPGVASGTYSAKPSNVISVSIDTKSGLLATDASGSDVRTEYFTKGTQPTETDTLHQTMDVCSESGYQATPSCPNVETKSGILRPYTPNKRVADIGKELPHYYCNLHNPDPDVYKVKKGLDVTIVQPGEVTDPDEPGEGEDPMIPDDPDELYPEDPNAPDDPANQEEANNTGGTNN